jgi:NAD(P)H-hydrate epimerase
MIDCISVENMRQSDTYTIENFVPSLELMYRAAYGVFESVDWHGKIAIIAGSGNNGGDGYALACILKDQGYDCTVYFLG